MKKRCGESVNMWLSPMPGIVASKRASQMATAQATYNAGRPYDPKTSIAAPWQLPNPHLRQRLPSQRLKTREVNSIKAIQPRVRSAPQIPIRGLHEGSNEGRSAIPFRP